MTVETLSKVRRLFHIQGWSLRKISRELLISRNTVRKALQSGTTKFSYKRQPPPPVWNASNLIWIVF